MLRLRRCFGPALVVVTTLTVSLWAPGAGAAASAGQAPPGCTGDEIRQRVRTDQGRYAPGQPVEIRLVATNVSDHDCAMPGTLTLRVYPTSGPAVWHVAVAVDWIRGARWRAGHAIVRTLTWDQTTCTSTDCSGQASPGTYVAVAGWDRYRPGQARFIVNGIK